MIYKWIIMVYSIFVKQIILIYIIIFIDNCYLCRILSFDFVHNFEILSIKLAEKHLWEVGNGRLYDLVLTYGEDNIMVV